MATPNERFLNVELQLRTQHVQQLKELTLHSDPPKKGEDELPTIFGGGLTPLEQLQNWSKEGKKQIDNSIAKKVVGGNTIDWNIAYYTLMESAAVYLRDSYAVYNAIIAAKEGRDDDAIALLRKADEVINTLITQYWNSNMRYVTVCDLLSEAPDGHWFVGGPYCGAFFCIDKATPFIGIAFKGTDPTNWRQVVTDLTFSPIKTDGDQLWGTDVSRGVYYTIFHGYKSIQGKAPFEYILNVLHTSILGQLQAPVVDLHVTGHSLGASYATLCYAELLRLYNNQPTTFAALGKTPKFVLRDLNTVGSPRIALENFADNFYAAMAKHSGHSWRLRNQQDPIAVIPPALPFSGNYIHVDSAYLISDSAAPVKLPTERGTQPSGAAVSDWLHVSDHFTGSYQASLMYIIKH